MQVVLPSLRILIVEDHLDSRAIVSRVLRDRSHRISDVGTAAEGLALFAVQDFDLVICDIGLPDYDGYELHRRMQAIKPVKTIALTGHGLEADRLAADASGFACHLTKPIELPVLLEAIEQAWKS